MASHQNLTLLSFTIIFSCMNMIMLNVMAANVPVEGTGNSTWCVARSDASNQVLQTALDYACGTGADCTPIQPNGLCYLPNTIQAHASYAFNSYFQRKGMAPGSCDFSGTATIAKTDPSYGSCMYPSSLSTAGGTPTQSSTPTTTTTTNPNPTTPATTAPLNNDGGNGANPGMGPPMPTTDDSKASSKFIAMKLITYVSSSLVLSLTSLYI
ncbi:hypothetical protein CICLE_v10005883mg [Citrus x clementina]|uniref:X8 domain-containing protein n=1 Tax=Citrus clementina TaxID=85681 RepID=V4S5T2_CITCL|nr:PLASMODESMATA CALLOSE-BINDING PROTEIN 3 [Citrus x clementina]ESR34165.1 hypothetical protein CICLE_v10005883mg [Citrus x clementina]